MNLVEITLDTRTRYQYNNRVSYTISTRTMYDDYEFQCENNNESYTYDFDEMYDYHMHNQYNHMRDIQDAYTYEDDEYARDSCDYDTLAYRHYA